MKNTIQKKIFMVFLAAIILSATAATLFTLLNNMQRLSGDVEQIAKGGANLFIEYLKKTDINELTKSEESAEYKECRRTMRYICENVELDYLYLFTYNEDTRTMRYIISVADYDETDKKLAVERGLNHETVVGEKDKKLVSALHDNPEIEPDIYSNEFGLVYSWYVPVKNAQGEVIALVGAEKVIGNVLKDTIIDTIPIMLIILLILMGLYLVMIWFMYQNILQPIRLISRRMDSFITDSEIRLEPLGINSNDEIQGIADSFENMAKDIASYIKDIQEMTTERVNANVQLDVARRIQYGIVPKNMSIKNPELNISALATPAKSVGGDFYDGFVREDGTAGIIIGDVSGKGIAAALFMVMTKTMIREHLNSGASPAETLNFANDELCSSNPEGMFVTVFAAVFDPRTGKLTYANAGHTRPVIVKENTELLDMAPGIALGLFDDAGIEDGEYVLKEGDGIVIYTDGITEAVSKNNSFFGEENLINSLNGTKNADDSLEKVINKVTEFTDDCEQFDDITILSLFYDKKKGISMTLRPDISSLNKIKKAVLEALKDNPDNKKILLAVEEIFVNIVSYSGATEIEFCCETSDTQCSVTISDDGVEFDPINTSRKEKEFEELDTGGMGIMLVKQIAKSLIYKREFNRNILEMVF